MVPYRIYKKNVNGPVNPWQIEEVCFRKKQKMNGIKGLTIFVGKLEALVGKSNGSHHSVSETSENTCTGYDLRQCNFSTLFSLFT